MLRAPFDSSEVARFHGVMRDEDPSEEDIERFSGETAFCPDCGAEVWDEAEVCPECHAYLGGNSSSKPPVQAWFQRKWIAVVIILLVIALVFLMI